MLPKGFLPFWQIKVLDLMGETCRIKLIVSRHEFNRRAVGQTFIVPYSAIWEFPGREEKPHPNQEGWVEIEVLDFQIEAGMITIRLPRPKNSNKPDEHFILEDMLPTHLFRENAFKP